MSTPAPFRGTILVCPPGPLTPALRDAMLELGRALVARGISDEPTAVSLRPGCPAPQDP